MSNLRSIPRNQILKRRLINVTLTVAICSSLVFLFVQLNKNLIHSSYLSGYLLFGCLIFLTVFNMRKRLNFLPQIGSAALWMQFHIYVGLATVILFGSHISWQIPNGWLECTLALFYVIVAGSGVYGLLITRVLPKRLTALREEVVFERIPALRVELAYQARQIALDGLDDTNVLPKFYMQQLLPFFERPRGLGYLILPNGRRKRRLVNELFGLERYLSEEQRGITGRLAKFIQKKDDLDYHYAMQGRLKVWLFFHIGFTYGLLLLAFLHAAMVMAFAGGPL